MPGRAYTDPALFEAERAHVLRAGWAPVARESDLPAPGDFRAIDLFGAPLVIVRDEAGVLRVLSGVCRHRGAPVAEGAGNAKAFICPYHLWRYGLDGRLLSAPAMEQSKVFAREACALPEIASAVWGGFVFANLSGGAPALTPALAPLAERFARYEPESLVTADIVELDSPWNWKVMVENFMESYHHIGPHAQSLQRTHPGLGTHAGAAGDLFAVLENPAVDDEHPPFVVAAIFPLTLLYFSDGPLRLGIWYQLDDIAADRFRLRVHVLTPPEIAAAPEFVAAIRDQVMAVHAEDIAICERTQVGIASPLYEPGPLSHLEACLWRFHLHLKRAMAAAA